MEYQYHIDPDIVIDRETASRIADSTQRYLAMYTDFMRIYDFYSQLSGEGVCQFYYPIDLAASLRRRFRPRTVEDKRMIDYLSTLNEEDLVRYGFWFNVTLTDEEKETTRKKFKRLIEIHSQDTFAELCKEHGEGLLPQGPLVTLFKARRETLSALCIPLSVSRAKQTVWLNRDLVRLFSTYI